MGNKENLSSYRIIRYYGGHVPKTYENYIFSKWARSYRYGNDYIKLTDSSSYYGAYRQYIVCLLMKKEVVIRLAVLSEDEDVALGFSVTEGKTLHYVHVHKDVRRQYMATHLVPKGIDTFTHLTRIGMSLWVKHPTLKFDPFSKG